MCGEVPAVEPWADGDVADVRRHVGENRPEHLVWVVTVPQRLIDSVHTQQGPIRLRAFKDDVVADIESAAPTGYEEVREIRAQPSPSSTQSVQTHIHVRPRYFVRPEGESGLQMLVEPCEEEIEPFGRCSEFDRR